MTKIKINALSRYGNRLNVYIDGEKALRCLEADEQEGVAWILREPLSAAINAKPGDFICDGAIIKRITARVEVRFVRRDDDPPEEEMRREIAATYQPIRIVQVVQ